jgi:hypothetical protein
MPNQGSVQTGPFPENALPKKVIEELANYARLRGLSNADELLFELLAVLSASDRASYEG